MPEEPLERVRADLWLWAARLFKTRSLATAACTAGHVKIGGESIKPSRTIRVGDRLGVLTPGGPRDVEVAALGVRRGPAAVARTLYVDHTPPPEPKPLEPPLPWIIREKGRGRPSKRDRRRMDRFRGDD